MTGDTFTVTTTLLAAFFNLLSIAVVLVIFLAFLLPRINRGVAHVERGEALTEEIRVETLANRARVVRTQEILERQSRELEEQRQVMARLSDYLKQWEARAKRAEKGGKP